MVYKIVYLIDRRIKEYWERVRYLIVSFLQCTPKLPQSWMKEEAKLGWPENFNPPLRLLTCFDRRCHANRCMWLELGQHGANGALAPAKAEDGTHLGVHTKWRQTKQQLGNESTQIRPANMILFWATALSVCFHILMIVAGTRWAKNTNWPALEACSGSGSELGFGFGFWAE